MQLSAFLKDFFSEKSSGNSSGVVCFTGQTYPLLFFSSLFRRIQETFEISVTTLDVSELERSDLDEKFSMGFLGQCVFYWCKDISLLDARRREKFLNYMQSYRGEQRVVFFADGKAIDGIAKSLEVIDLDDARNDTLEKMYDFWGIEKTERQAVSHLLKPLKKQPLTAVLDRAFLLMHQYGLGADGAAWFDRIVSPEKSLFTLSQYFFAKDRRRFFGQWLSSKDDYPPEFWLAFWSEQLWQAASFLESIAGSVQRKGNRLPFSFTQRDWRSYKKREFAVAHNFLYSVDYSLKNGYGEHALELFLLHFLLGDFAQN